MRLHRIAPGHALLRHRPRGRWLLLATAALLAGWAVATAFEVGFTGGPMLASVLGALLLVGGVCAVRTRVEIEIGPGDLRWFRRRPFGRRDTELHYDRGVVEAVRVVAGVVAGNMQQTRAPRMSYEVELLCGDPLPRRVAIYSSHREGRVRAYARALCGAANLPLVDATGEREEVRAPEALGGRPPVRVAAPEPPPPPGVRVDPDPLCGEVATLRRWTGGGVTLHVMDGQLHIARSWLHVPLPARRFDIAEIEQVRVQFRPRESEPGASRYLRAGVAVVLPRRTVVFGGWLRPDSRRWVAAWLESRLWPEVPADSTVGAAAAPPPAATKSLQVLSRPQGRW